MSLAVTEVPIQGQSDQLAPPVSEASREQRLLQIVAGLADELRPQAKRQRHARYARSEQDLGLDSLSRMELLLRIERAFGVALPEQALVSAETRAGPAPVSATRSACVRAQRP